MEANTSNEEKIPMEGNIPTESGASSRIQTGVGQKEILGVGGNTPISILNQTAATSTPHPANPRPSTPPSLQRLARELKELKSSQLSNKERVKLLHDQRRQLLSHMASAKSEINWLEVELGRIGGSQNILDRLRELKELHEWAGGKWRGLGDEVLEADGEIAMPGG